MTTECALEKVEQSPHSPGIVHDDEPIVFALIDPETFKDGLAQLSRSKLKKEGISVCRALYVTRDTARKNIVDPQIASNSARVDEGILSIVCLEIRNITLNQEKTGEKTDVRGFCVLDEAYKHYRAHAHVKFAEHPEKWMGNARNAAYLELYSKLKELPILGWNEGPFSENDA